MLSPESGDLEEETSSDRSNKEEVEMNGPDEGSCVSNGPDRTGQNPDSELHMYIIVEELTTSFDHSYFQTKSL